MHRDIITWQVVDYDLYTPADEASYRLAKELGLLDRDKVHKGDPVLATRGKPQVWHLFQPIDW